MNPAIQTYARQQKEKRQETLIVQYAPLVKRVAYRLIHRVPPSVDLDDLLSVGTIGLIQAIENFDAGKGTRFEAYAEFRIKGAMLDELRSYDFMSRAARGRANKIERARQTLEAQLGRAPTVKELAEASGYIVEEVEECLALGSQMSFMTLEDMTTLPAETTEVPWELLTQSAPGDPFGHAFFRELREQVVQALDGMPERLKLVMSLYYSDELNFKEIGRVLDLTESRISQLHSEAIQHLKRRLAKAV